MEGSSCAGMTHVLPTEFQQNVVFKAGGQDGITLSWEAHWRKRT